MERLKDVERPWLSNDDIDTYVKHLNVKYGQKSYIMQTTFFYGFLRSCVDVVGNQISEDMAESIQKTDPMKGDFTADIEAEVRNYIDNYPKKEIFKEIEQVSDKGANNMLFIILKSN